MPVDHAFSMIGECCDRYAVEDLPDGRCRAVLEFGRGWRKLWLAKLADLSATEREIAQSRGQVYPPRRDPPRP